MEHPFCVVCATPIPPQPLGRPRHTCGDACRQRLRRSRRVASRDDRWHRADQTVARALRQLERRFGPLDDTPADDGTPGLRWRLAYRIARGLPIGYCAWCGRPFIPAEGPGSRAPSAVISSTGSTPR